MKTPIYTGLAQSDLDANGYRIFGLHAPTASADAATKAYVDAHSGGGGGGGSNPLITVNVQDAPYSAAGDGVTDDTVAIQSAIDAVAALGGGTVFLPRGTYLCNGEFDTTTNSILKIPFNAIPPATTNVAIMLLGETPPLGNGSDSIIKSAKTGTGTFPAILAAGPYAGAGPIGPSSFNYTYLYLNTLMFLTADDPSISALRLDVAINAALEDVWVQVASSGYGLEPTHGTIGVWMPNSGSGAAFNYCNRVTVAGFDTALRVGEHFRCPNLFTMRCKQAIEFLGCNNGPSWVNLTTMQCVSDLKFSGFHAVQMLLDTEHAQPAMGWYSPSTAIADTSNFGRGEIKYGICTSNVGAVAGPITISGGNYLTLTDFYTGITTLAPSGYLSGTIYIGTDARLVAVSGGVKLEVRNTGTGTWVEATRYTNP